mgnify:CR=1 FL=1
MALYLLDTNHLAPATVARSPVRLRIENHLTTGDRFGVCVPVLCEFEIGIQQSRNPESYRHTLRRVLRRIRVWPMSIRVAHVYGRLAIDLRRRGRALSQVDMMLAALALQMNATLLTSDRDFDAIAELRCENWLTSA